MAILVPDDRLFCFNREKIWLRLKGLAFYPGPVLPPRADGSPLTADFFKSRDEILFRLDGLFFFDSFSWEADLITIEILIGKRICLSLLRKKEIEETLTMALVIVGKVAETASKSTFCWKWINQLDPLTYQKWIGQLDPLNFDVSCARCTF